MGDVVRSRQQPGAAFMRQFKNLVAGCNETLSQDLLSPLTITLGDEFQGIARSLPAALDAILWLEEKILESRLKFKLRYVVHHGRIDTPINRAIAYEMVGPGLTAARELLTGKKRGRPRARVDLPARDKLARQLNRLLAVLLSLKDDWKVKDYGLVLDMLGQENDSEVARLHAKDRSQIWRRRKTLHVEDYRTLKAAILEMAAG
ncbi:hypothetical protein AAU61_14940 [Desulfocarbo indianensis]|nr:hypothetical protein AAU61_14940 [Desulfocarbo indianensis]